MKSAIKKHREGELYRIVALHGKTFNIYYGYYDERDRKSKYNDPIPIYPDFRVAPEHSEDGHPFVTGMQDACSHFSGRDRDDGCHGCKYYEGGDDLIGLCKCPHNKK